MDGHTTPVEWFGVSLTVANVAVLYKSPPQFLLTHEPASKEQPNEQLSWQRRAFVRLVFAYKGLLLRC